MSSFPERTSSALDAEQESGWSSQDAINTQILLARPEESSLPLERPDASLNDETSSHELDNETLRLDKAKVEQLAYLLLSLVGSTSGRSTQRVLSNEISRTHPGSQTRTQNKPGHTATHDVTQKSLERLESNPKHMSQLLLRTKPWSSERVAITSIVTNHGYHPDEHFLLQQSTHPFDPPVVLSEDGLYMAYENHAWKDLHTYLGPGKFTEEGQLFWLREQASHMWPRVIPPPERAGYLIRLWTSLTIQAPPADKKFNILSDLAKEGSVSMTYKQLASKLLRRPTTRTAQTGRNRNAGVLSRAASKAQKISRSLFSTADSARARLPSTTYLRIIGQNLFTSCLSIDEKDYGETILRVLIASLHSIAEREDANVVGAEFLDPNKTVTNTQIVDDGSQGPATVWDLLAECYRTAVLVQPAAGDESAMREQVSTLLEALHISNIITSSLDERTYRTMPVDELLSCHVKYICSQAARRRQEPVYPTGTSEYFGKKDLSIKTLQDVGVLNIMWTRCVDDHLILDTDTSEVRIFWPMWALANIPSTHLFTMKASDIFKDLLVTYSFLFYSPSGFSSAIRDYNGLDAPSWLLSMNTSLSELTKHRVLIGDSRYHFASYFDVGNQTQMSDNKNMIRFNTCGVFEDRVRILKGYMDSQKPSGLRALWRDKRDSSQWYTFWLVLWVGGISILLGLASLAVSIAQTVASFEALKFQIISGNFGMNQTNTTVSAT